MQLSQLEPPFGTLQPALSQPDFGYLGSFGSPPTSPRSVASSSRLLATRGFLFFLRSHSHGMGDICRRRRPSSPAIIGCLEPSACLLPGNTLRIEFPLNAIGKGFCDHACSRVAFSYEMAFDIVEARSQLLDDFVVLFAGDEKRESHNPTCPATNVVILTGRNLPSGPFSQLEAVPRPKNSRGSSYVR